MTQPPTNSHDSSPDPSSLASAAAQAGDWQTALWALREVLAADPHHLEARYRLGWVLGSLGQVEEAIQAFRQVLQADPHHLNANYNLGALRLQQAQLVDPEAEWVSAAVVESLQEAQQCFERVMQLSPDDQRAYAFLTIVRQALRRYQQASPAPSHP
ncbi:MAG: tetratricopeptide repeat protein [Cyanobacteriota bacterium]|nr:tetratricopeptide repeat protein [Cyanobacteriota bacterium]